MKADYNSDGENKTNVSADKFFLSKLNGLWCVSLFRCVN